jgi:hypothetical protein
VTVVGEAITGLLVFASDYAIFALDPDGFIRKGPGSACPSAAISHARWTAT